MSKGKRCWIKSVDDVTIKIPIQDKVELLLGRSPETNIRDKRCSKNQVSLLADYSSETVTIKHLGGNPSSANGKILRNESYLLRNNDSFEFLVGKYQFKVDFESTSADNCAEKKSQVLVKTTNDDSPKPKRKCTDEVFVSRPLPCQKNVWEKIDSGKLYIFTSLGVQSSSKIAAYDLDGTIILTKTGRVFPKDKDDWKLANAYVKTKLTKFASEGFKIVILTNQAGIGKGKTNLNDFKQKMENIIAAIGIPVQAFVATSNSIYRKPIPGMWNFLENNKNDGINVDMNQSFFVGDAAGRIANWAPGRKKDFSIADRLLALNLKLQFFTPEEHFLKEPPGKFTLPLFNPSALDESASLSDKEIISKTKEVVIMVGYPGSGKSHFATRHLVTAGYAHVNRDTLGSWQKCVLNMEAALASGRSVVVDNTNPDRESRKRFIDKALASGVYCRCFLMTTTIDHVRHNNRFRELTDSKHIPVNDMIINSYKNKFEEPSLDEGFADIVRVTFVPFFTDPELKSLYQMYLLEK